MIRVTLDTNVYISALAFGGRPLRVLEMATEGLIAVSISDAILDEVARVLTTKLGWSASRAEEAVSLLAAVATRVVPGEPLSVVKSDPDDDRVLECAVAANAEYLVTGDSDLLRLDRYRSIAIVTPARFLEIIAT